MVYIVLGVLFQYLIYSIVKRTKLAYPFKYPSTLVMLIHVFTFFVIGYGLMFYGLYSEWYTYITRV